MHNERNDERSVCRSVFKSGDSTTGEKVTEKWIELINRLEKNKPVTASFC